MFFCYNIMTFKEKLQRRARKNNSIKALVKFSPYDIILAPVLTEKTYKQSIPSVSDCCWTCCLLVRGYRDNRQSAAVTC